MSGAELWLPDPEEHDYPAASSFLTLLLPDHRVVHAVMNLQRLSNRRIFKAKDILRASGLPLLPADNRHVRRNLDKIHHGELLSPLLLVRSRPLIVADGYHRLCAAYHRTEDLDVPCRITAEVY